jgi:hypothetical protein
MQCSTTRWALYFHAIDSLDFLKRLSPFKLNANTLTVCLTDLDSLTSEQSDAPRF